MEPWVVPALTVGAGFVGGLFGTYVSKRGEIHAVHRELEKVVAQNTAITKATEEIRAKISDEVLTRQRHRDLKREAVFDALKYLSYLGSDLEKYIVINNINPDHEKSAELFEQMESARRDFANARNIAMIFCAPELVLRFTDIESLMVTANVRALEGEYDAAMEIARQVNSEIVLLI